MGERGWIFHFLLTAAFILCPFFFFFLMSFFCQAMIFLCFETPLSNKKPFSFIYLFGCTRSQFPHVRSSWHHGGSLAETFNSQLQQEGSQSPDKGSNPAPCIGSRQSQTFDQQGNLHYIFYIDEIFIPEILLHVNFLERNQPSQQISQSRFLFPPKGMLLCNYLN